MQLYQLSIFQSWHILFYSQQYQCNDAPRIVLDKLETRGYRVVAMTGVGQTCIWTLHKEPDSTDRDQAKEWQEMSEFLRGIFTWEMCTWSVQPSVIYGTMQTVDRVCNIWLSKYRTICSEEYCFMQSCVRWLWDNDRPYFVTLSDHIAVPWNGIISVSFLSISGKNVTFAITFEP